MLIAFNINISFQTIFAFIFGIVAGITFAVLLYAYTILLSLKDSKRKIEAGENMDDEEVLELIKQAKSNYLLLRKSVDSHVAENAFKETLTSIIYDIAKKFNPTSKRPLFELTIDEALLLTHYITNRVDELLDHKGLGFLRKRLKISQIMTMADIKRKVEQNALVKASKKVNSNKFVSKLWMGLNVFNPVYWAKKMMNNVSNNLIMKNVFLLIIDIAGQETFKIYSKRAITLNDKDFEEALGEFNEAAIEMEVIDEEPIKKDKR